MIWTPICASIERYAMAKKNKRVKKEKEKKDSRKVKNPPVHKDWEYINNWS